MKNNHLKKTILLTALAFILPGLNAQESSSQPTAIRRKAYPIPSQPSQQGEVPIPSQPSQQGAVLQKNYKGHSYRFVPNYKSWHEAEKDAQSLGGYLVVVTDKEEDEFVLQLIRDANNGETPHVWIGLTDEANEGELKWANGEKTVYWRNSSSKFLPSDVGDEDFVHYYAAPLGAMEVNWNDNIGSQKFAYVIECDQERPELVKTVKNEKTISVKPLDGTLFYGYEDDGSFVYAMFLKKTDKENEYEVTWTLPFYDQKYRNGEIFLLSKNSDGKIQFKRGRPEYHLYDAEIDVKGNLINGSRFVLEKSKNDKTKWNLFKVK